MSAAIESSSRPRFLLCIPLLLCPLAAVQGQVRITALAEGANPLKETSDIWYTRVLDFEPQPLVQVGQELADGDLLESATGRVLLELTCPQGSLVRFWGQFRVVIQPTEDRCAFNMLAGNSDFLAVEPTEIGLGGPVAGSRSTQYGVRLARKGDQLIRRVLVFEGEVFTSGRKDTVKAGEQLVYEGREPPQPQKIAVEDLKRTAEIYARFDVSKALYAGAVVPEPAWLVGELSRLHYDVLEQPGDPQRRNQLGSKQREYKIDAEANYNLQRANPEKIEVKPGEPLPPELIRDAKYYCLEAIRLDRSGDPWGAKKAAAYAFELNRNDSRLSAVSQKDYDTCKKLSAYREEETKPPEPVRDSKYWCLEAMRLYRAGDPWSAKKAALTALDLHGSDGRLSDREYGDCKKLSTYREEETKPPEPVRDSKYWCDEAIQLDKSGDRARAAKYASQALGLHRSDGRLSEKEYATCKKLAAYEEKESKPPAQDSRYYCTEASKAANSKDMKTAAALARRGLALNNEDHRLTKAEYDACSRLVGPD